jgi:hypothetical protein
MQHQRWKSLQVRAAQGLFGFRRLRLAAGYAAIARDLETAG